MSLTLGIVSFWLEMVLSFCAGNYALWGSWHRQKETERAEEKDTLWSFVNMMGWAERNRMCLWMTACVFILYMWVVAVHASWTWGLKVTVILANLTFLCELLRLSCLLAFVFFLHLVFSLKMSLSVCLISHPTISSITHLLFLCLLSSIYRPHPSFILPLSPFQSSPLCFTLSFSATLPCVVWRKWVVLNVVLSLVSVNSMERADDNL